MPLRVLAVVIACFTLAVASSAAVPVLLGVPAATTVNATSTAPTSLTTNARTQIDRIFAQWDTFGRTGNARTPGFAVGVVKNGRLIYGRGYGHARLIESTREITIRTRFDIASVSKHVTAFCLGLLIERGQVDMNATVATYLTGFRDNRVKVRHLIYHTSSMPSYFPLMSGEDYTTDAVVTALSGALATGTPGAAYAYSNSGYVLIAGIVKAVSGLSLKEYAQRNVFTPLGMRNTYYQDSDPQDADLAAPYRRSGSGWTTNWVGPYSVVGDGGLITTVEDMAIWTTNLQANTLGNRERFSLGNGGATVTLQQAMTTSGTYDAGAQAGQNVRRYAPNPNIYYGFGLEFGSYSDFPSYRSHGGSYGSWRARMLVLPNEQLSVILLSNANPTQDMWDLAASVARLARTDTAR
jgi:CubicO group peptidase (beta-lactamase class C family)